MTKKKYNELVEDIITKYDESEEIISNDDLDTAITEITKKEIKLEEICEILNVNELEVFAAIARIRSKRIDIIYYDNDNELYCFNVGPLKNNQEDVVKFSTDENNSFKALVISDTRFGSKEQQLEILKNKMENAKKMGINTVILCGNITEGLYSPKSEYFDSVFLHGTENQGNYVIDNFPKIEGMTTYFITGPKDETHIKKNGIDIGNYISNEREDMVYLGRNEKEIFVDNVSIKLANLKAKKTYTVSYRCESLLKSIRSEDKSDILLYGGLLQQDKFQYRDINCLSVPSLVGTTPEMKDKYSNTVGDWCIEVITDKKGNLEKLLATASPNYVTNKNEYTNIKPSSIILNSNEELAMNKGNGFNLDYAKKVFRIIKNGMTINDLANILKCSPNEALGIVEFCKMYYLPLTTKYIASENNFIIEKGSDKKKAKPSKEELSQFNYEQILVVSDTHLGNNAQQLHLLNDLYKEAHNRGVTNVLHVGDLVDGDYSKARPEHPYQVFLHGFDEQSNYVLDMYPFVDGLTTYYILGSHDETHKKNGGATLNNSINRYRDDMVFLGQDEGRIKIDGIDIALDHPGGGSANGLSYKPQKRIEAFETGEKPKIHLIGHYHKSYYFLYRNVHCIEVPSLCAKTQFQKKMTLSNAVGGYFIHIYYDKKGNVQYFLPEEILYNKKDFWEEAGKDRKKVKQLYIQNN